MMRALVCSVVVRACVRSFGFFFRAFPVSVTLASLSRFDLLQLCLPWSQCEARE